MSLCINSVQNAFFDDSSEKVAVYSSRKATSKYVICSISLGWRGGRGEKEGDCRETYLY